MEDRIKGLCHDVNCNIFDGVRWAKVLRLVRGVANSNRIFDGKGSVRDGGIAH